ncbi:MAG: alginate export family protein [Candidatus Omnitrophica bacterium]|nr:alginate export family protein [Candidatus Omnitrophota bacterium]
MLASRQALNFCLSLLFCLSSFPLTCFSQSDEASSLRLQEQDRQISDEENRQLKVTERAPLAGAEKDFALDYGIWLMADYRHYNNIDNDKQVEDWIKDIYTADARLWVNAMYYDMFMIYGRLKTTYIWKPNVSSAYNGIGDDLEGPKVDSLYGQLFLHNRYNIPLSVRVGRQFLTLGRGITYSDMHDGVEMRYQIGKRFNVKTFVSKTKEFDNNIDYSVPGYTDEGDRHFFGAEASFIAGNMVFYAYTLVQRDLSHENPTDHTQNYTYDSEYVGIGGLGRSGDLSYWFEVIKEYGKSYTDAAQTNLARKDIDAWAFDIGAKYSIDAYSHPKVDVEMAYGSGDKERSRVTNTSGGNVSGRDTNFMYFGVFNAGYALAPRLSNMYIYKVEASCKPIEFMPYIGENVAVGAKYFLYRKDEKLGGIYDVDATESDPDIGQELDFYLHWKVYENFYFSAKYGIFYPGAAYPHGRRTPSEYFYARVRMIV